MKRLIVSPQADADLRRLAEFLAPQNDPAARRMAAVLHDALSSLREFPERGRASALGVRELVVRFGRRAYVVRYGLIGDDVVISRILHSREAR